jgi:hypothetical protein
MNSIHVLTETIFLIALMTKWSTFQSKSCDQVSQLNSKVNPVLTWEELKEISSTKFQKKFSILIWVCSNFPAMKVSTCLTQDHQFKLITPVTLSL